jgi:hypothetical protein
MAGTVIKN